jgi:hypothetical protein
MSINHESWKQRRNTHPFLLMPKAQAKKYFAHGVMFRLPDSYIESSIAEGLTSGLAYWNIDQCYRWLRQRYSNFTLTAVRRYYARLWRYAGFSGKLHPIRQKLVNLIICCKSAEGTGATDAMYKDALVASGLTRRVS